jgi:hypothetical protein
LLHKPTLRTRNDEGKKPNQTLRVVEMMRTFATIELKINHRSEGFAAVRKVIDLNC